MRTLFFTLLMTLGLVFPLSAQIDHTSKGPVDKNAETILTKASALFQKSPVSFTVTLVNIAADKKETARQSVRVLYNRGCYRVTMTGHQILCDKKSLWHWDLDAREVVVSNLQDATDELFNPPKLLANYKASFRPKYIRTDSDGTAIIDLTPKSSKSYHKLRLFINEKTGRLVKGEIHNYDGSCGRYLISNFQTNAKCAPSDFTFDPKANKEVEVIDMR